MALRWRVDGTLICAAKSKARKTDTYINDRLHYELSVQQKTIVADKNEETNGLWHWLHGECLISEHPQDCRQGPLVRGTAAYVAKG